MQNIFDETSLDQLHTLTAKRVAAIRDQGEDFTLSNSEKAFKGILAQDRKSITFDPATPVHPGAQFDHKGGSFIVLASASRAGCQQADVAEVVGTAVVYQKQVQRGPHGPSFTLSPAGVTPGSAPSPKSPTCSQLRTWPQKTYYGRSIPGVLRQDRPGEDQVRGTAWHLGEGQQAAQPCRKQHS